MIVVDSNALIGLAKGDVFDLLHQLFGEVAIPLSIRTEVVEDGAGRPGAIEVSEAEKTWLRVLSPPLSALRPLGAGLDADDRDVLVLAHDLKATILTDDEDLRKAAVPLGIPLLYTVDVLWLAKRAGFIVSAEEVLKRMVARNFGVEAGLYQRVLNLAGETP